MTVCTLAIGNPALAPSSQISMSRDQSAESELIRRAKSGDLAAFEELFRLNHGRVYALCLRMVADPGRAEDLTQDSFVRAWQKLDSFRARSAFGTWLHRLAVNVVLGDMRSQEALGEPDIGPREHRTDPGRAQTAARFGGRGRPGTGDRRSAGAGPRTVFVLHDVEGYKHREIADMIGLAEGTSQGPTCTGRETS